MINSNLDHFIKMHSTTVWCHTVIRQDMMTIINAYQNFINTYNQTPYVKRKNSQQLDYSKLPNNTLAKTMDFNDQDVCINTIAYHLDIVPIWAKSSKERDSGNKVDPNYHQNLKLIINLDVHPSDPNVQYSDEHYSYSLASGLTKLKHALQIEQSKTNKCYDALDNKINQTLLDASNCYLN